MNWTRKILAMVLVGVMPGIALASETDGAVLQGRGPVEINSETSTSGMAIRPSDHISTKSGAQADLTARGLQVSVTENSNLTYDPHQMQLQSGLARVATSSGAKMEFKGIVVEPKSGTARYAVGEKDGQYLIAALDGDLLVSASGHSMVLQSGKVMTRAAADMEGGGGGQQPMPTAPLPGSGGGFWTPWHIGLIVGLAAGLGFLIGWAAAGGFNSGPSASPTTP